MSEADVADFRARFRLWLIERLALKFALGGPVFFGGISIEQSGAALKDWLDLNSSTIDAAYGARFRDPAMAALYADEAKEVVEDLKRGVDEIAQDMKASRDRSSQ